MLHLLSHALSCPVSGGQHLRVSASVSGTLDISFGHLSPIQCPKFQTLPTLG